MWDMMDGYGGGWSFFAMFIGWLVPLFIFGLIIWLVYEFANKNNVQKKSDVEDIARERYAKGEIKKEEYDEIIGNLRK